MYSNIQSKPHQDKRAYHPIPYVHNGLNNCVLFTETQQLKGKCLVCTGTKEGLSAGSVLLSYNSKAPQIHIHISIIAAGQTSTHLHQRRLLTFFLLFSDCNRKKTNSNCNMNDTNVSWNSLVYIIPFYHRTQYNFSPMYICSTKSHKDQPFKKIIKW